MGTASFIGAGQSLDRQLPRMEFVMDTYLDRLLRRHQRIDRLIDTSKAHGKQEDLKLLKRARLQLKDRIAELQVRNIPILRAHPK